MWGVKPVLLCRQHLLGEHLEMHMFAGTIKKKISIAGYLENNLVDISLIKARHDDLAAEMTRRGYNHNSPLKLGRVPVGGRINRNKNLKELYKRCPACRQRIKKTS